MSMVGKSVAISLVYVLARLNGNIQDKEGLR
jgi:hypothetical protein